MSYEPFSTNVLLRSEESGDRVAVVENTFPPRFEGPPLHHHEFDEAFYVLEGELTFQVRDQLFRAGSGELVFAPGGVPHTLANLSSEPARYLLICTPAGFERYFDHLASQQAGSELAPEASKPYPETIVVGPPIGEPAPE